MTDQGAHHTRHVIYSGAWLHLEYTGPALTALAALDAQRVIVAFGPFDYPGPEEATGWGAASFAKRDIAHVCVFHRAEDWHQNDEFFDAMAACRAFLGDRVKVTTYGFSMGGYGALLGAPTLKADRAVAVSPQSSIDPQLARFERRYDPQWAAMGPWKHDLRAQISRDKADYIVLVDPLHRLDMKHENKLPKPRLYTRCLIHGAGHAGLQTLIEMGIQETLFDLLRGTATPCDLRHAYRAKRKISFRYLRKVGTKQHERRHAGARGFLELAKDNGFRRLIKKWRPYYA